MKNILKRIGMYAIPFLGIAAVAGGLFVALSDSGRSPQSGPDALLVLCDEDVRYPLESPDMEHESGAAGRFLRRTGVRVKAEYGSAGELVDDLILGRAGDLLLVAAGGPMDRAGEAGLVYETRRVALLVPVILVRTGNPYGLKDLADLADPNLRLAVADSRTSLLGQTTNEVFEKNGLDIHGLDNIRFVGDGAREVAEAVRRDRADAALVWRPVAALQGRRTDVIEIDPERNVSAPLLVAVLEASDNREAALMFADFISGPTAGGIFETYGFDTFH